MTNSNKSIERLRNIQIYTLRIIKLIMVSVKDFKNNLSSPTLDARGLLTNLLLFLE